MVTCKVLYKLDIYNKRNLLYSVPKVCGQESDIECGERIKSKKDFKPFTVKKKEKMFALSYHSYTHFSFMNPGKPFKTTWIHYIQHTLTLQSDTYEFPVWVKKEINTVLLDSFMNWAIVFGQVWLSQKKTQFSCFIGNLLWLSWLEPPPPHLFQIPGSWEWQWHCINRGSWCQHINLPSLIQRWWIFFSWVKKKLVVQISIFEFHGLTWRLNVACWLVLVQLMRWC